MTDCPHSDRLLLSSRSPCGRQGSLAFSGSLVTHRAVTLREGWGALYPSGSRAEASLGESSSQGVSASRGDCLWP